MGITFFGTIAIMIVSTGMTHWSRSIFEADDFNPNETFPGLLGVLLIVGYLSITIWLATHITE